MEGHRDLHRYRKDHNIQGYVAHNQACAVWGPFHTNHRLTTSATTTAGHLSVISTPVLGCIIITIHMQTQQGRSGTFALAFLALSASSLSKSFGTPPLLCCCCCCCCCDVCAERFSLRAFWYPDAMFSLDASSECPNSSALRRIRV